MNAETDPDTVHSPRLSARSSTYNLLDEHWIPVARRADGDTELVGLLELFERMHEFRWLVGENPVMTAALHRFIQAVAHRAVHGPMDEQEWRELWLDREALASRAVEYLRKWRDRFWLVHPGHPFLQCPGLVEKEMGTAALLVLGRSSGNNRILFDHTTAADRPRLTVDEATRWLITLQAYDPGGTKTPFTKDKFSANAPCVGFGVTLLEGRDLRETLLLNLPPYAPKHGIPASTRSDDRPIWEADEPPGPEPDKDRVPRGWTDWLTWPSRRILLNVVSAGNALAVDGVVITPGDGVRWESKDEGLRQLEQQAAFWRERDKRGRPKKEFYPVSLKPLGGVWRYAAQLLLGPGDSRAWQRPAVMDHVARWADDQTYTLRVIGQRLNPQGGVVDSWGNEWLPAPVALLRLDPDHPVEALLGLAVDLADDLGSELEALDNAYDKALKAEHKRGPGRKLPKHSMLSQWYWPRLDGAFRRLLTDLSELLRDDNSGEAEVRGAVIDRFHSWHSFCDSVAKDAAQVWAERSVRFSERQVMVLGKQSGVFHSRLRTRGEKYQLEIESFRRHDDEEGGVG